MERYAVVTGEPSVGPLQGATILVVEDQAIIALDLENLFYDNSVGQVLWARGLEQARKVLATNSKIDLALLDLHLGTGSGFDLVDELKARGIAIVLASGFAASQVMHEKGRDLPLVEKPYHPGNLLKVVSEIMAKGRGA